MSVENKTYWEVGIEINPICADILCDIIQSNFECEGIVTAEETYKNLEMIATTENLLKAYIVADCIDLDEMQTFFHSQRQDLIDLGDWGRAQDPDYWLNSIVAYEGNTIVTDIRVKHELDLFRSHGAFAIRVEATEEARSKRGVLASKDDVTETQLDSVTDWDYVVENNEGYEELLENTEVLIKTIKEKFGEDL